MADTKFPVAYFFQKSHKLTERKKVVEEYSKRFDTQLFELNGHEHDPKIKYLMRSEEALEKADGVLIGDNV
ncbi:hypothetical protein PZB74_12625 [Porifericola rhodea]|uniref:hypothetical protein n=1 Tax=Porifericola rhodea TaxID=930972 RepID=UPI002665B5AB|nr:hypothetical protein [Porifericola rhodea]WKN29811.1 hypothetical protein PZB74_12625 [Porifericola rhodea]